MKRKSMSKNLTRKGLAFGALVALGASVFAGAPAYAADSVILAADYSVDKTLAVPVTETIRLNASLAPGSTAANIAQLTYKVVTDSTTVASVQTISGASTDTAYNKTTLLGAYTATSASAGDKVYTKQTPLTSGNTVTNLFGSSATALTTTYFKPATTPTATNINTITLGVNAVPDSTTATTGATPAATSATRSVTVTAFIDANLNGLLDSGEVAQEQTVKFLKYSEVTTTSTITAPTEADTTVTALVKFTNVNNQALADVVTLANGGNGSNAASIGAYFTKGDGTALRTLEDPVSIATSAAVSGGNTLTVTTTHAFAAGDKVTLAGLSAYNGTYDIATVTGTTAFTVALTGATNGALTLTSATATRSKVAITAAAIATNVLTITAKNTYAAGDVVTLAGLSANNGSYVIASATSSAFTIALTAADATLTPTNATATRTASNTPAVQSTPVTGFSATNDGFKFTTGTVAALGKSTAVKVQPLFNSKAALTVTLGQGGTKTIGTAQTAQVATRALGSFKGSHVLSTSADSATAAASVTNDVALNGEKQVYFIAKDTASTPAAKAGQAVAVAVTLSGASLSSTITLTVNGTTYTSDAALPGATGVAKLALTTGADGKASITYKTKGFSNGNDVIFTAVAENFTATVTGNEETLAYTTYIANNEGNTAATVDGTAVELNLVTQDQFGGAPVDGTFQISAVEVSNSQATAATSGTGSDTFAAVVGGKSTLKLLDNGTGVGNAVFGLTRYTVNASGVVSAPTSFTGSSITASVWGTANGSLQFTVAVKTAADIAAGEVLVTGSTTKSATTGIYSINASTLGAEGTEAELTYSAYKNVDLRTVAALAPTAYKNDGTTTVTEVVLGGTVNSASTSTYGGVAIPSAAVTVSGAGLMFSASQDSADVYGDGSLTFYAGSDGTFSFKVWSHKAGKQLVTIKSGTGTATAYAYFKAAAELDASVVTVKVADGAAQFQAGRALDVAITVADSFGNPVALDATWTATTDAKLTIAQTGSGYLSTSGDVVVTSTGSYATKLITNAGDLGTSTISATLDFKDADLTDVAKTVSSEFGVTDADVTVGGRAVYASVEFAKGKTVTVSVDGRRLYSKLFSTDAYTELKFTQKKAGKHTVTVRVSGGIVYSEVVTTTK
jgi:hypothetical protein